MKKMKKRVAVSCYEFQIVGLERSKRGLRGRPTTPTDADTMGVESSGIDAHERGGTPRCRWWALRQPWPRELPASSL